MTITSPPPAVRRALRLIWTVVLAGLVAPVVAWAVIRLFGLERGWMVQLVSFTPYAAAVVWLRLAIALADRRRVIAAIGVVASLTLAGCVLPRALPDRDIG